MSRSRRTWPVVAASLGLWVAAACVGATRPAAVPLPKAPPTQALPPRAPPPAAQGTPAARAPVARQVTLAPSGDETGAADARALQAALTGAAPGTIITLAAGDFYLDRALVADGFVGTVRGGGMDRTTVHVTGTIRHLTASEGDCRGTRIDGSIHLRATPANPWPFVLNVIGGDLTLSDLTFATVPGATAEFCIYQQKVGAIAGFVVIAGPAQGSRIVRVRFVGHAGSFEGYGVLQATYQEGLLYGGRDDWPLPVTGRHLIEGCDFEHVFAGSSVSNLALDGVVELRHNTYGTGPGTELPVMEGLELWSTAGQVRFEDNVVRTSGVGVIAVQGISEHLGLTQHTEPVHLLVARNRIVAESGALAALDLTDLDPALLGRPGLSVEVRDNHLVLSGARYGVVANGLAGARFVHNTLEGEVTGDGLLLGLPAPRSAYGVSYPPASYPTVGCRLTDNDLAHLRVGRQKVWLGPFARGCVVAGRAAVRDQGRGNRVLHPR